jgi:SRSO17 transposase
MLWSIKLILLIMMQKQSSNECRERIANYAALYDRLFKRDDQREWFRLYILGLLTAPSRKNVEAIAATVAPEIQTGANLAQALQHFVSESPWEHSKVLARYRECLPPAFREGAINWVIHESVLLKKGSSSVGTQRQMAWSIKKKVNCQVAVVIGITGKAGYVPLSIRLYLPRYWLREHSELAEKTVPRHLNQHFTKQDIAVQLIEELRAEGWVAERAIMEEGYSATDGFLEALAGMNIRFAEDKTDSLQKSSECFEALKTKLGLDHFEGRTWTGWHHHAAMVFAAKGFLLTERCKSH